MTARTAIASTLRSTALGLVLAGSAFASAHADDAFGGYLTNQPTIAARSAPSTSAQSVAVGEQFKLGRIDDFGGVSPPVPGTNTIPSARLASNVPMVEGSMDVVGAHGPQDDLASTIYRPGSCPGLLGAISQAER